MPGFRGIASAHAGRAAQADREMERAPVVARAITPWAYLHREAQLRLAPRRSALRQPLPPAMSSAQEREMDRPSKSLTRPRQCRPLSMKTLRRNPNAAPIDLGGGSTLGLIASLCDLFHQLRQRPQPIRNTRRHGRGDAQGPVNGHYVVVRDGASLRYHGRGEPGKEARAI